MRIFKKIFPFIAGLLAFFAVNALLGYLLIPYQFTEMKIHTLEHETFHTLFLGSSHAASCLDPAVWTEQTGESSFNAAAGGQYPRENYSLLLDASREHKPEQVILEYDPAYWISYDNFNKNARYQESVMALSPVRLSYFSNLCLDGDIRFVLMPWFLYRENIRRTDMGKGLQDALRYVRNTVSVKQSDAYKNKTPEPFNGKDQICRTDGMIEIANHVHGNYTPPQLSYGADVEKYVQENQKYFEKTIQFCQEHDIEVIVVTTPVPEETKTQTGSFYQEAHEQMQKLSDLYGFTYLDFVCTVSTDENQTGTTAETSWENTWEKDDFSDGEGHMHTDAAKRFTKVLASML